MQYDQSNHTPARQDSAPSPTLTFTIPILKKVILPQIQIACEETLPFSTPTHLDSPIRPSQQQTQPRIRHITLSETLPSRETTVTDIKQHQSPAPPIIIISKSITQATPPPLRFAHSYTHLPVFTIPQPLYQQSPHTPNIQP